MFLKEEKVCYKMVC
jgi:hypothetical protein